MDAVATSDEEFQIEEKFRRLARKLTVMIVVALSACLTIITVTPFLKETFMMVLPIQLPGTKYENCKKFKYP